MEEYYYFNKSCYRVISELFELIKYGKLNPLEIKEKFEISQRQIAKDIACLKTILYDYFGENIELYYIHTKKEYQIIYNKGTSNYFLFPFDYDKHNE